MDFFIEYFVFDGHLTVLQGLWDLVSFSELSHWKMIFLGFLMGFVLKKFYTKQWGVNFKNLWIITYPVAIIVALVILTDSYTKDNKSYLSGIKEQARAMDYDYNQWRKKNLKDKVNPEWKKDREQLRLEINHERHLIMVKLSNQSFFLLFLIVGFFYKKHTIKNSFSRVKNEYQEVSREVKQKKEQERQHKELEEKQAYDELKSEELRLRRMEEKRLEIALEKERTKQTESENAVKLKKFDVERPEKEKNISDLLKKLDDL